MILYYKTSETPEPWTMNTKNSSVISEMKQLSRRSKNSHRAPQHSNMSDNSADTLVTLDRYQIVVPEGARKEVLDLLHIPHQGQTKTYMAATTRYYWPKMKEEVIKKVEDFPLCREFANDQQVGPPV